MRIRSLFLPVLIIALFTTPSVNARFQTSFIAYQSDEDGDDEIYIMDENGENVRQITSNRYDDGYLAISPDGLYIAYETYPLRTNESGEIGVIEIATGDRVELTNNRHFDGEPEWAPFTTDDGEYLIVYETRPDAMDGDADLRVVTFPSAIDTDLIETPLLFTGWPDWSPDGESIAFLTKVNVVEEDMEILITPLEGEPVQLTDDDLFQDEPQWSPDSRLITFSAARSGRDSEIYIIDVETKELTQITDNTAEDERPGWSPDGKQIVFASDRDGDYEIYVMDVDGKNLRQLTENRARDYSPRWWGMNSTLPRIPRGSELRQLLPMLEVAKSPFAS